MRGERFRLVNNRELYDIEADPGETTNVIDDHPAAVEAMRAAYDAWWAEVLPMMVNEDVPNAEVRPYWFLYEAQLQREGNPELATAPTLNRRDGSRRIPAPGLTA